MADITMCDNEKCPLRMECFRYRAIPNPYRQSYFADIVLKDDGTCDNQMPIVDGKYLNGYNCSASITYNSK